MTTARYTAPDGSAWGEALVEPVTDPESAAYIRKRAGAGPVLNTFSYLANCRWVLEMTLHAAEQPVAFVSPRLVPMMGLVVSRDSSCRHCYGGTRALLRMLGYTEPQIQRIETDLQLDALDETERAALEFIRLLSRGNPRPVEKAAELRDRGVSEQEIAELVAITSFHIFSTRINTLLAVPPDTVMESMPERWFTRLLAPLLRRKFLPPQVEPTPLPSEPDAGAFAPWIRSLEGSPYARIYCEMLSGAWRDSPLPLRTRALLFGVVGRALDCRLTVSVAKRTLAGEGMAGEDVEEVLDHLASPLLDPVERRLVPFARDTVRYRVGPVQASARAAFDGLAPDVVVDAVATLSLANAVSRMSLVVEPAYAV